MRAQQRTEEMIRLSQIGGAQSALLERYGINAILDQQQRILDAITLNQKFIDLVERER